MRAPQPRVYGRAWYRLYFVLLGAGQLFALDATRRKGELFICDSSNIGRGWRSCSNIPGESQSMLLSRLEAYSVNLPVLRSSSRLRHPCDTSRTGSEWKNKNITLGVGITKSNNDHVTSFLFLLSFRNNWLRGLRNAEPSEHDGLSDSLLAALVVKAHEMSTERVRRLLGAEMKWGWKGWA